MACRQSTGTQRALRCGWPAFSLSTSGMHLDRSLPPRTSDTTASVLGSDRAARSRRRRGKRGGDARKDMQSQLGTRPPSRAASLALDAPDVAVGQQG